ncbi:MAG: ATP-dependent zinc metalloprotease FtsH [Planctomycetota bacterium]
MSEKPQHSKPPVGGSDGPRSPRFLAVLLGAMLILGLVAILLRDKVGRTKTANIMEFAQILAEEKDLRQRNAPRIDKASIYEDKVTLEFSEPQDGFSYWKYPLLDERAREDATEKLRAAGIGADVIPRSPLSQLLPVILPMVIILVIFYLIFLRQMRQAGADGAVLSFGKSRAKLATKKTGVTFDDVAGINEAKEDVTEIIAFLKDPKRFERLGGRIPKGVLLIGPPGSGKTLLAKAIAGEADVPFYSISGSDFVEMFVGVGASRVRDLFRQAKENAPCIIFLDEIDAVGRRRGHGWGGGHDEREQTLNAILVEMDGFDTNDSVILLAATNRPDVLDPALRRPGRFDREVMVDLPDLKGREAILKVHARRCKLASGIDLSVLARGTPMFSGADLEAIINESAIVAVMKDKDAIEMEDLEEARDKIAWGRQKRSRVMAEEDKLVAAFHEAGHTLVTKLIPEAEPLHKVTIIPRGMAVGSTMSLPERDRYQYPRSRMLAQVAVLFAGRTAEEIFCNDISSGSANDIKRATDIVRSMVREWGMSDVIGPVNYADSEEKLFGGEVLLAHEYSEATAIEIDKEVRTIVKTCLDRARTLISEHKDACRRIAEALLKYEVLSAEDVDALIAGKELAPRKPSEGGSRQAADPATAGPQALADTPGAQTSAQSDGPTKA